jgi:hypothetical protein
VETAHELRQLLFTRRDGEPDLNLSVYRIAAGDETQVHAEHAAAVPLDLPQVFGHFDAEVMEPPPVKLARLETRFAFSAIAHAELQFASVVDLDAFASRVFDQRVRAHTEVSRQAVQDYVCGRLAEHDSEWLAFALLAKAKSWTKRCPPADVIGSP